MLALFGFSYEGTLLVLFSLFHRLTEGQNKPKLSAGLNLTQL